MDVRDLISHFAAFETVPIDVQDHVVPVLKDNSDFELFFWPMPLNTGVYRGLITQWEGIPYGDEVKYHVSISYADNLPPSWQRLVCCKELIHILDPIDLRVTNESSFNKLIEKIVLPPEMQDSSDGTKVWNDRFAIWQALAVLFPWATRELFVAPLADDKISIETIAELVDLPVEYAAVVMNDVWAEHYHLITR